MNEQIEDLTLVEESRGMVYVRIIKKTSVYKKDEVLDLPEKFASEIVAEGIAEFVSFDIYKKHQEEQLRKLFVKSLKDNKKEKLKYSSIGLKIDNYMDNAAHFYERQPFFYDKQEVFWFWNELGHRWEIVDDVDLMRKLDTSLGFMGQTVSSGTKRNYIEAFKRVGRDKMPKEAPEKWIQFKNKAFSLKSGSIYEVTPDYFFTNPIPHEIGPSDETPTIDKLFNEWAGEKQKETLYEIIAYCCYTSYPIQVLFCLHGNGRNGKTCFLRLLSNFIGKENLCSTELDLLVGQQSSRFESFKMYKKLACMMGETNFGVLNKSSLLKKLTGGDLIGFEMKGKKPFDDYNYAKMLIASNSLPTSEDTSDGFYRRWIILDFPNQFPEGKDIIRTIPKEEYNNLAKKIIQILPKLIESGTFTNQGNVNVRKNKYIMASNPLPIFLKEYCISDESEFISYNELYTMYVNFLRKKKKRRVKTREFKSALEDDGFWVEKTSKKVNDEFKSGYWIIGLRLKTKEEIEIARESDKKLKNYDNYDIYTGIPAQKKQLRKGIGNVRTNVIIGTEITPSPSEVKVETIEDDNLIWLKCHICNLSPSAAFDSENQGKPICEMCIKGREEERETEQVIQ